MEIKDILLVALPIMTAILSSYLTYYFAIKSKQKETITRFNEEKYSNLIIALQGFVGSTVSVETKRKFFEEQYKSWLYSSDEVVNSINELIRLLIEERGKDPNPEKGQKTIGNIILAMRKDLLGKTKLTNKDFRYTDVII
jgi:DNA-directed RNA polymerase subunit E'/Rpb7